jgi:hypothetical protein
MKCRDLSKDSSELTEGDLEMRSLPDQALQPPPKEHLVTCREMNDLMSSSSEGSAQEGSAEHPAKCERCRILTDLLDQVGEGPVPSESQLKRIS